MIDDFKLWFDEIQTEAITIKRSKAKENGNEEEWKKEIWKSPDKNKAIKMRFRDEGVKLGYKSRPSYVSGAGEWLYDFVWREFDQDNNLIRIVLAMEIEVSDMDERLIKYDFNKLLQAESKYKILVFQLKSKGQVKSALKNFRNAAYAYEAKTSSEYLLCGWCTSRNEFLYDDFVMNPKFT